MSGFHLSNSTLENRRESLNQDYSEFSFANNGSGSSPTAKQISPNQSLSYQNQPSQSSDLFGGVGQTFSSEGQEEYSPQRCRINEYGSSQTLSSSEKKSCSYSTHSINHPNNPNSNSNNNSCSQMAQVKSEIKRYWDFLDKFKADKKQNSSQNIQQEWENLVKVRCGDPKIDRKWVTNEEVEEDECGYGMPDCNRCKYLHCKCGLCRNCRIYNYVSTLNNYKSEGDLQRFEEKRRFASYRKVKRQEMRSTAFKRKYYDELRRRNLPHLYIPGRTEGPLKIEVLGGPLLTETKAQYRIYGRAEIDNAKAGIRRFGEEGENTGREGRSKGQKVKYGPNGEVIRPDWKSFYYVPSQPFQLSLEAAEAKLRELDRMLQDPDAYTIDQPEASKPKKSTSKVRKSPKTPGDQSLDEDDESGSDSSSSYSYTTTTISTKKSRARSKGQKSRPNPKPSEKLKNPQKPKTAKTLSKTKSKEKSKINNNKQQSKPQIAPKPPGAAPPQPPHPAAAPSLKKQAPSPAPVNFRQFAEQKKVKKQKSLSRPPYFHSPYATTTSEDTESFKPPQKKEPYKVAQKGASAPVKVASVPPNVSPVPTKVSPAPANVSPVPPKVASVPTKVASEPVQVSPLPAKVASVPTKVAVQAQIDPKVMQKIDAKSPSKVLPTETESSSYSSSTFFSSSTFTRTMDGSQKSK